jgi:succinate-acetate transporter protein
MSEQASDNAEPRAYLQPIAPPSVLGLYGFAGATIILASHVAGWWGDSQSAAYIFPFAAAFGGVAQFAAGMWSYKARDVIATAMHGMWGSFWVGWGILELLFATGAVPAPSGAFPAFGMWFAALAWITLMGAVAATWENIALTAVLGTLTLGAGFTAVAEFVGSPVGQGWALLGGWTFIVSAVCAWYTGSALMLEGVAGRPVLPVGLTQHAQQEPEVAPGSGEPGVAKGQ